MIKFYLNANAISKNDTKFELGSILGAFKIQNAV